MDLYLESGFIIKKVAVATFMDWMATSLKKGVSFSAVVAGKPYEIAAI
ncbi:MULTISPECIES: hypothetical protein [unclassified Halomonas]|nr:MULTISPECIES: hypothetical protein [unclassified Halomonas]